MLASQTMRGRMLWGRAEAREMVCAHLFIVSEIKLHVVLAVVPFSEPKTDWDSRAEFLCKNDDIFSVFFRKFLLFSKMTA